MGMILPLLYLGVGFGLAMLLPEHWGNRLKESASALLTRWIIPTVIVYIVATSRPELFFMAASTMVLMALLVRCAAFFTNDPVQRLALVYLNAGIFGIPVVASFWGEEAVRLYVGAYIGNSVMVISSAPHSCAEKPTQRNSRIAESSPPKKLPSAQHCGPCSLTAPLSP